MSDRLNFKDVWQKDDAKVERDATAAWHAANQGADTAGDEARAKALCAVGYEGDKLCTFSTVHVRYMQLVRENMAFLQVFVVPQERQKRLVIPLTYATHDAMRRYALEHPELNIGGTAALVVIKGTVNRPVLGAEMVLVAYSARDEPIVIRWFDHFKIDEDAARARNPRRMRPS